VGSRSKARARAKANQARRKGSAQAHVAAARQARPGSQPQAGTGTAAPPQAGSPAAAATTDQLGASARAGGRARFAVRDQPAQDSAPAQQQEGQPPGTVLAAAAVQGVEAIGVLAAAVLAGIDTGSGRSYHLASGIAITIIGVCTAGALGLVAHGLRTGRRWSRTPAVLTQLFVGIVAIYLLQAGRYDWGVPFSVLAVGGLATILAPPSVRLLTPGRSGKASKPDTGNIARSARSAKSR
jgi:hypothetical protein